MNSKSIFLAMLLWLMANPLVHAQTQAYKQESLIDKTLERCLEQNESTMGTIRCLDQAYINWDRELNTADSVSTWYGERG